MIKKAKLQTLLIIILVSVTYFIYAIYYKKNDQSTTNTKNGQTLQQNISNENQNLIQDIKYTSSNGRGDIYEILADYGESSLENSCFT